MSKYRVHLTSGASVVMDVEADSRDEAIEKAEGEVYVSLCHQCARQVEVGDIFEVERDEKGEPVDWAVTEITDGEN